MEKEKMKKDKTRQPEFNPDYHWIHYMREYGTAPIEALLRLWSHQTVWRGMDFRIVEHLLETEEWEQTLLDELIVPPVKTGRRR